MNPCGSEGGTRTIDIYIPGFGGGGGSDPNCPEPPCEIPHAASYGINSNSAEPPKIIYQNRDYDLILAGYDENTSTTLYSLSGQLILNSTKGNRINTYGIRPGLYVIVVEENGRLTRQRILLE